VNFFLGLIATKEFVDDRGERQTPLTGLFDRPTEAVEIPIHEAV
jgi:hypothetical protein